jgi:predicted lactoylglutathione lyase
MDRRPLPLANTITLGVQNFGAQRDFYRRLGWPLAFDSDDFAVFEFRGALLALFPVEKLAADSHAQPELSRGGIRFSIIISVDKPEEVDELAERVRRAGGKFTKDPVDAEFFAGRDAYFVDPEGNFWEIACAPPDNPVVIASRRAAGLVPRPKRVKAGRKAGGKKKKKPASGRRRGAR